MTKAFFPLLQNNIKLMFGLSKDFKERRKNIAIYLVFTLLLLPILVIACVGLYYLAKNMPLQMLASLISSIMFASEIMVLFFGVQSAISLLFYSKDNEMLIALPVSGLDIFVSKVTTIYLLHLGLALLIQLPVILATGIGAGIKNFGFYILGFVGSLLTPFIPLFIITIIAVPLGYVISYFKRNNIVGTILVLLLFCGVFAGYYYLIFMVQNSAQSGNFDMASLQTATKIMSYIVYPNTFIATSMVTTGLEAFKNFAIFFAIILALAVLSIFISAFLYKGSARRGLENGNKKTTKIKENEVESVYKSLVKRDIKNCLGETSSAINYLLGLVIPPIVMIMMSVIYADTPAGPTPINIVASTLAIIFGCGMNYFAIVAFSREGRQMDILKMLPVPAKTIINQKIILAGLYVVAVDVILFASMLIAKVNFVMAIIMFVIVLLAGNGINIFAIYYDLKSPNFVWSTNKELFKNNSKSLTSMALSLPLVIVSIACELCFDIFLADFMKNNLSVRYMVTMLPVLVVAAIYLGFALYKVYPKLANIYECMEI